MPLLVTLPDDSLGRCVNTLLAKGWPRHEITAMLAQAGRCEVAARITRTQAQDYRRLREAAEQRAALRSWGAQ